MADFTIEPPSAAPATPPKAASKFTIAPPAEAAPASAKFKIEPPAEKGKPTFGEAIRALPGELKHIFVDPIIETVKRPGEVLQGKYGNLGDPRLEEAARSDAVNIALSGAVGKGIRPNATSTPKAPPKVEPKPPAAPVGALKTDTMAKAPPTAELAAPGSAPVYNPVKFAAVPDSVYAAFPDLPEETSGLIDIGRFTNVEQAALRKAGLVTRGVRGAENTPHEGVSPEDLWPERKARAARDTERRSKGVSVEGRNAGIEKRAANYERLAAEQETLGELGDTALAAEYRKKAAEIRASRTTAKQVPSGAPPGPGAAATPPGGATPAGATPAGATPPATPAAAPPQRFKAFKTIAKTIENIFSPTTRSAEAGSTEASIRRERGLAERDTEKTKYELEQFTKQVGALPQTERDNLIAYIEGRSAGAQLTDPSLQPIADKIRTAVEDRRQKIANSNWGQNASFIEDYYMHMWKNTPQQVQQALQGMGSKQGSGRNLKARSIPTIADGKARGLTPVTENPIEMTNLYVQNMDRFIAANNAFDEMRTNGLVRFATPGKQPPGWVEVKGRLGNKNTPVGAKKAYAPEDAARVYNNFISRGFDGTDLKDVYEMGRKTSNYMTMMELGLSAYHASTMGLESIVSEFAKGIGQFRRGEIVKGAKTSAKALTPWSPYNRYKSGLKAEQEYLGVSGRQTLPNLANVVRLQSEAGGRAVGYDRSQHATGDTAMGSFWRAWKRGTLGQELKAIPGEMKKAPLATSAANIARVMETVAEPLFGKLIPRLKNGAFYSKMQDWLEANPGATPEAQVKQARELWDSIDNRFGELVMDNVFWNKFLKQAGYLMVRSTGWDLGTIREIGGGAKDLLKGKPSQRTDYLIALPIVTALYNAAAQYIKTGKGPEGITDLFAYQTGGKNPDGSPERAMIPGYMKDIIGYAEHPLKEAAGKLASAPTTAWELVTNKDYRGLPLTNDSNFDSLKGAPQWVWDYAKHVASKFVPISVGQFAKGEKKGSNIGAVERALAIRPANAELQNPKRIDAIKKRAALKAWIAKNISDRRLKSQYPK